MNNPLFDISPYQSATTQSYSPDCRDATSPDPAWDEPELEPNLKTSTAEADGDAPTGWRSSAAFTITLKSGQAVDVKFIPALAGEMRMHQFDFTGPVSPTGFKSHFVPGVESEEFSHLRDYAQTYADGLIAEVEEKQHSSKNKERSPKQKGAIRHLEPVIEQDDSSSCTVAPIPAISLTAQSLAQNAVDSNVTVQELQVNALEVLPPVMTEAEARQCIAAIKGHAVSIRALLVDLEERRGFEALGYPNMSACMVAEFKQSRPSLVKELKAGRIEKFFLDVPIGTFLESHFRPLSKLKPEYYKSAFNKASTLAGERPVTAKDVSLAVAELLRSVPGTSKKDVVERLKQRDLTPPPIPYQVGDVVLIRGLGDPGLKKYDGQWAIALAINEYTVTVALNGLDVPVKPQFLEPVSHSQGFS